MWKRFLCYTDTALKTDGLPSKWSWPKTFVPVAAMYGFDVEADAMRKLGLRRGDFGYAEAMTRLRAGWSRQQITDWLKG